MKRRARSISIDDETWNAVAGIAKSLDRSTSDYVRIVLREHIKQLGKKPKKEK